MANQISRLIKVKTYLLSIKQVLFAKPEE